MAHLLQMLLIGFALVGIGHTLILVLCNIQEKEVWSIDTKYELSGILLLLVVLTLGSLLGEI